MYYQNGTTALRGLVDTLEAEAAFARITSYKHAEIGNKISLAEAHAVVVDSIAELQKVLDDIRESAMRNVDPF